jgi:hypothetical protein
VPISLLKGVIIPTGRPNIFPSRENHPPQVEKEVIMKKVFMILIPILFLLVTVGNAFGEDMAKEGATSGRGVSSGTWKGYPLEEGTQFMTWEQKGVSLNDDPKSPFHNLSQNCAGVQLWNKGEGTTLGYCIGLAPDGDKILFEVKQENLKPGPGLKKGTYKYIGGTGKFAGIEGGGEYSSYGVRPAEDGTYQNVMTSKGSYKVP